jgi:hypothetical protein
VYFTINRYVELSEDNIAHHLWIPLYSETAHDDLVDFVDARGEKAIEEGRSLTHKQAKQRMSRWLK